MEKKNLIQFFLLILVILIFLATFYTYVVINKNNEDKKADESLQKDIKELSINKDSSNIVKNVKYNSKDSFGNEYEIFSDLAEINLEDPNIVYMTDVKAKIDLKNSEPILIYAKFATYNSENYDTNFKKNIIVTHLAHMMKAENLDLLFKDNILSIYENVIYKNYNTKLNADRVEMDLITKNSKIFMYDKSKKVNIFFK